MLTKADDFPIHQTPEPIAYSGTDRNFYDRYFFNGYQPDGTEFFAIAFGVYPHLNVADAHFSVIRNGIEHCLHASRVLHMERMDLTAGPIRIEVLEPLQKLKVTVAKTDGIAAEIVFEGRTFPIEEPRFMRRIGPRAFMDYTRLTQNVRCTGWIEVDGVRKELAAGTVGTRDRSWGVRPGVGGFEPGAGKGGAVPSAIRAQGKGMVLIYIGVALPELATSLDADFRNALPCSRDTWSPCSRRKGSGRRRPIHLVSGHPVAARARCK